MRMRFRIVLVKAAGIGQIASAALSVSAAVAVADPGPHLLPEPGPASPPVTLISPSTPIDPALAQPAATGGLTGIPDLARAADVSVLLGQNPVPVPPGAGPGVLMPTLNALNNAYLLPLNDIPSAPGEGTTLGVAPGEETQDVSKLDYLKRLWGQYRRGDFEGALLGRRAPGEPVRPGQVFPPMVGPAGQ